MTNPNRVIEKGTKTLTEILKKLRENKTAITVGRREETYTRPIAIGER